MSMSRAAAARDIPTDLGAAPERIIDLKQDEVYAIPLEEQHGIQLQGARTRFADLVERIPILTRLAEEQSITQIRTLDDLAPLLVPHSALKSYPMAYLEKSQFDRLTQWLNGFTTYDLSGVNAGQCDSIDDWLALLDAQTTIRVLHSTGTSGKLSFLPRGTPEMKAMMTGYCRQFDRFRDEPSFLGAAVEKSPIIFMQYRKGGMAQHRLLDYLQEHLFGGDARMIVTTNPTRFSADAASIGGRLRVAEAKGELGTFQISAKLTERRDAFLKDQEKSSEYLDAFFEEASTRLRGKTVSVMGHVPMLYNIAVQAGKRGVENLFARNSFVAAGGGMKGHRLPDDWLKTVDRFLGGAPLVEGYGMTEVVAATRLCPGGHYHIPTWHIPFLLDPDTGQLRPRTGTATGRYGAFDLNAQTYWGGFLTGDEVTLSWGDRETCVCGRIGPYLHHGLRRYTEKEGGDDKITCAGAPEAHDKAIEFVIQQIG
jgi:hypothetical protein